MVTRNWDSFRDFFKGIDFAIFNIVPNILLPNLLAYDSTFKATWYCIAYTIFIGFWKYHYIFLPGNRPSNGVGNLYNYPCTFQGKFKQCVTFKGGYEFGWNDS